MVLHNETLELYKKIRQMLLDDLLFVEDRIKSLEEIEAQMDSDARAIDDMIREGKKLGMYKEE